MFQLYRCDAGAFALYRQQLASRQPFQLGEFLHPALQDRLGCSGPVTKATHPVLIQSLGLGLLKGAQKGSPETGLPRGELTAIGATNAGGAHHASKPVARGEQQGAGTAAGRLDCCGHAAGAAPPHQDIHCF